MTTTELRSKHGPMQRLRVAGLCAALGAAFIPSQASTADETRLLADLRKAHPGTEFTQVTRSPVDGVYEVWCLGRLRSETSDWQQSDRRRGRTPDLAGHHEVVDRAPA